MWTMAGRDLPIAVAGALALVAQAQSVLLGVIGEADDRGVAKAQGLPSSVSCLRARHKLHPGDAAQLVRTAAAFRAGLPATRQALAAGEISLPHAQGIRRACAELPDDLDPVVAAEVEARMARPATSPPSSPGASRGTPWPTSTPTVRTHVTASASPAPRSAPPRTTSSPSPLTGTTSSNGPTAAPPASPTVSCYAGITTASSNTATGRCGSTPTTTPAGDHHPGPTPSNDYSATTPTDPTSPTSSARGRWATSTAVRFASAA